MNSTTPTISDASRVGQLATRYAAASRIFEEHGIDYCCGGARSLAQAAEAAGRPVQPIIDELIAAIQSAAENEPSWSEANDEALIAHIISAYHRPLEHELPRLVQMSARVLHVHGDATELPLRDLAAVVAELAEELLEHMQKEERVLFPLLLAGGRRQASMPIHVMEAEHDHAGSLLRQIRTLTNEYAPPQGACATWRALYLGLAELELELHQHIHLENNVLFQRAQSHTS